MSARTSFFMTVYLSRTPNILYNIKGVISMLAVDYSTLKNNLETYCDKATDDSETIIVTRNDGKNLALMSLDMFNNLMENLHVMGNKANYEHIQKSINEIEKGHVILKTDSELEALMK